jgi:hypothetical protein
MYATESKAGKKKFFLQESRIKASPRKKLRAVCPKERGLIERPVCFQEHIKKKRMENRRSESEK